MSGVTSADEAAIRSVMSCYENALNASDTQAAMPLYTEDGVFMAPNNQPAVGEAARQARLELVAFWIGHRGTFRLANFKDSG